MAGGYGTEVAAPAAPDVEACKLAQELKEQGYLVLKNVIKEADCDALRDHVWAATDEARRLKRTDLFGNIQEVKNRTDLKLDLCVPVIEALNQVVGRVGPIWTEVMGNRVRIVELSSITSDPGAVCQAVHADTMHGVTRFLQGDMEMPNVGQGAEKDDDAIDDMTSVVEHIATDTAMIYTCLVALQDVEPDMGPTHVWPGTNTVEHHATLWGAGVSEKLYPKEADKAFKVDHKDMTLKKGDLVVYDSRTMHCGGANISDKRRSVLVVSSMGPGIRPDGTTWTMLGSLRNRFEIPDFPLSLSQARSPVAVADPNAREDEIELPPEEAAVAEENYRAVPDLKDWEAAVQCIFCRRWRACSMADAPKFANSEPGFHCTLVGFSCMQEQKFTKEEIDEAIAKGPQVDSKTGEVSDGNPWGCVTAILDWYFVEKHVPWGVVFLMGGGFSLAFCSKQSGFSCWMAQNFSALAGLPVQVIAFVITVVTGFFTEFASNAATGLTYSSYTHLRCS